MISGPNGAHFSGSVETENLRAPPTKDLRLASLTRFLFMDAPEGMQFKSAAGSVGITSLKDVNIKSVNGKVCYLVDLTITRTAVVAQFTDSKSYVQECTSMPMAIIILKFYTTCPDE